MGRLTPASRRVRGRDSRANAPPPQELSRKARLDAHREFRLKQLHAEAVALLDSISSAKALDGGAEGSCKGAADVKKALMAYLDFVIKREK